MYDLASLAEKCGCKPQEIMSTAKCVRACMAAMKSAFSCIKTMDFTEAVVYFSLLTATDRKDVRLLELGTQFGLSTRFTYEVLKMRGFNPIIRTYDVVTQEHLFDHSIIDYRCEDIADRCAEVLDEFRPDAIFLDAHPWHLTYNMTVEARKRNLLILMHDVSDELWTERLQQGSLPLEGYETDPKIPWERKVLEELFGSEIHSHDHLVEDYRISIINSSCGLAICQPLNRIVHEETADCMAAAGR
jgi:hypothetical protein